jgi:hypothetical protein
MNLPLLSVGTTARRCTISRLLISACFNGWADMREGVLAMS